LQFEDKDFEEYNNLDKNTSNFLEDIFFKDYLNLSYKFYDSLILIIIFYFFYFYNLKKYKFEIINILFFISSCATILIINQIIKNLNSSFIFYLLFTCSYLFVFFIFFYYITYKRSE
jgi:hypothetical protein